MKKMFFATCLMFGLFLAIQPSLAWMFEPKGVSGLNIPVIPINETNWQSVKEKMIQMIEKRISELQKLLNRVSSANSAEELNKTLEQERLGKEKERIILKIEKMIEKLNESGDSKNVTKLAELKEKAENAQSLDELRDIMKELESIKPTLISKPRIPMDSGIPVNVTEQEKLEKEKQRLVATIERMIDKLQEQGDSENVTKLSQLKERIEKVESIEELREVMKELREQMPIKMPESRHQISRAGELA